MGADNIDWRSDQYSLGCSLYHMMTGKPPYEGSGSAVMRQHIKSELPDPRTINPKIPDAVMTILERMMAKNPADRFQDALHLIEDLELVKMGQSPSSARLDGLCPIFTSSRSSIRCSASWKRSAGFLAIMRSRIVMTASGIFGLIVRGSGNSDLMCWRITALPEPS